MKVKVQRHPKEHIYRTICLVIGGLVWFALVSFTKGLVLLPILLIGILLWISEKFFQAMLFGNSVFITPKQYPQLHKIVQEESSKLLGTKKAPMAFIYNSNGVMNALAVKFLSKKYIILYDNLVDVLWSNKNEELRMVISHEIAHHAAGHTNFWINLVIGPAFYIPYLGPAYSRSRELTADRTAFASVNNPQACMKALVGLASGAKELIAKSSIDEFIAQEKKIPTFFGFLLEILASHPRLTLRVIALMKFDEKGQKKIQKKTAFNKPAAKKAPVKKPAARTKTKK